MERAGLVTQPIERANEDELLDDPDDPTFGNRQYHPSHRPCENLARHYVHAFSLDCSRPLIGYLCDDCVKLVVEAMETGNLCPCSRRGHTMIDIWTIPLY